VYQYAAYRVLGRFDVTKRFPAQLASSTENWLWLQLCMVSEVGDAQAPTLSPYTLRELGDKLEKYGEAHFDPKGHRPLHYFQLLLLVGRFEKALAFLQSRPAFHVDVVHFATALVYYGLLRVPPAEHTSQFDYLTVSDGVPCFDYAKLIKRYTRLFAQTSRRDALAYISLVCLNSDCAAPIGQEQVARCHEQVRSLILESPTSAFLELLGDVRGDGDLFSNRTIDRALAPETIRIIFARLVDWGRAAYEPPVPRGARVPRVGSVETSRATHAQSAAVALTAPATVDTPGSSILVYWRTPDEWADELYSWLCNTGQNRSVLTMYELLHSRFVEDEHLPPMMLKRALQALVAKKRAQIFGGTEGVHDENLGVKFV